MSDHSRRIVVGYDGSADADAALTWAAETARQARQEVEVVVVASTLDPVVGHFHETNEHLVEEWRSTALDRLKDLDVPATVEVRRGSVVPELLSAAADAAMLVVGSTGHGLTTGTLTGSVSQHVARHAACPVVVVRPRRSPHAHRIVVGVDGSEESTRALRFACTRAQTTGETVTAVYGFFPLSARWMSLDGAESDVVMRHRAEADRFVAELCAGLATEFPDVEVTHEAIPVRPAQLLVDCGAAASLVVVGSRGRDTFAELLLGSVSQHVLHHAQCPVAVVR